MSVWICVPSARPVPEVREWMVKWRDMGYRVALWRDEVDDLLRPWEFGLPNAADKVVASPYPGYARASNELIAKVLHEEPECDWVVCGGDDVWPDPNKRAEEIAQECSAYFSYNAVFQSLSKSLQDRSGKGAAEVWDTNATFGVMQPTGDRWGDDETGRRLWPDAPAMIDRICGSPWIGREFAQRINQGNGPFWPEYHHNWADEELQNVAIKLGVFWQRRDLTHFHDHARRQGGAWREHQKGFDADYVRMKPLFDRRKAAGFPGHGVTA